jgi:hypothetical protein
MIAQRPVRRQGAGRERAPGELGREHSKASWRGKAVLKEYALASHHDGTLAEGVSRDDLEHRTGLGHDTIVKGRKEVLALGELEELEAPGGAGKVGRYQVNFTLCPAEARCRKCKTLARLLPKTVRDADGSKGPNDKNRLPQRKNRLPRGQKSAPDQPKSGATDTETDHPIGGTSPRGESDVARSARSPGGARSARSGFKPSRRPIDPATARHKLMMRAPSETEALAIRRLDDREVMARWQQGRDAPSA